MVREPMPKLNGSVFRAWSRPALDAILALLAFLVVSMTAESAPSAAAPQNVQGLGGAIHVGGQTQAIPLIAEAGEPPIIEIATTSSALAPDAVYRRTSLTAAWLLLSLAFSVVMALNLALFRHMRTAYATPRSRRLARKDDRETFNLSSSKHDPNYGGNRRHSS